MGHSIDALITRAPVDEAAAGTLDLPVFVQNGFAIVALYPKHCERWSEKLGLPAGNISRLLLDGPVTHEFARRLDMVRYAVIATDDFGGVGEQCAAVYFGGLVEMEPTEGGINAALQLLGVRRQSGMDEFDSIDLGRHRSFADLFKPYWE